MRRFMSLLGCGVLLAAAWGSGLAADNPPRTAADAKAAAKPAAKPEPKPEAKPAAKPDSAPDAGTSLCTVKREPFKIETTLKAVFEPETATEISLRPEVWPTLEVVKAVEHGATVKRGEVLVQFDVTKLTEEIAELRAKHALTELALRQAQENLRLLEGTVPLDLKQAERARQFAHEDRDKFLKVDRPFAEKTANFSLEMAEQRLEYEKEELRQLEKMYKADDLTEETEEIILKRQHNAVKAAEFSVEGAKRTQQDTLKIDLPRRTETVEQNATRQDLLAARAKVTLPLSLSQAQRELEKSAMEAAKEAAKLKKLEADLALLSVKSPLDGVAYYGRFVRGKWTGMETLADTLRPGGTVTKGAVILSVFKPRPLRLRAAVSEAELTKIHRGLNGTVEPAAFPDAKFPVSVVRVDGVPSAADSFEVRMAVEIPAKGPDVMPGMTGTVKLVAYRQDKALVVPSRAVFADDHAPQHTYVFLSKAGKPVKQPVTVGRKADDRTEILAGVREGDQLLLERPKQPVEEKSPKRERRKRKV